MCLLFIETVLDTLGSKHANVATACGILTNAIAPEVGLGTPNGLLARISGYFSALLGNYQLAAMDRQQVEAAISEIFALAACKDFNGLEAFLNAAR